MPGVFQAFTPKFVKKYANLAEQTINAVKEYVSDVKQAKFPEEKHYYKMIEGEFDKLKKLVK